ncbi:hypothetical protein BTA51_16035 [Hahella sp. CCB-MM4]|uniref:gamma-glutamylcyclotransferase family protein n=1 Tax=Hahella sp. (strain CCB-MM4) TaxID=1926491 RepID=UPI000B9B5AFE|nr:gamma-glutamylcyclotransferase family protein [Hahella sp. CCB-MM4]OZG72250.1 hypothetical protein BTA51_16035 [Hahella sp. CCB-MM4]
MLYFAYGSNLYSQRLANRLTNITRIGHRLLPGFQLRFHKVGWRDQSAKCDAFRTDQESDWLHGVLYNIPDNQLSVLDHIEGLGHGYERETVQLFDHTSRQAEMAFTYIATLIDPSLKPYDWYRHHVVQGAIEAGFPEAYVQQILQIEVIEDCDLERAEREWSIHR